MVFLPCTSNISFGVSDKVSVVALLTLSSISFIVTPVPAASAGISKLGIKSHRFVAVAVDVVGSASEILPGTPDIPNPDDMFEIPPLTASVTELYVSVTAPVISVTTSSTAVTAAPISLPNFVVPSSISLSKSKPLSLIA